MENIIKSIRGTTSHGQIEEKNKKILEEISKSKEFINFLLNITCSLITFIVEEYK